MSRNFTNNEIATIVRGIGVDMTARVNKCGNIDIEYKNPTNVHYVVYKWEDGTFKIRRRAKCGSRFGSGTFINNDKPFPTIKSAMEYFSGKYKKICKKDYDGMYKMYKK